MDEKGLLDESGGILERGLDGSLKSGGASVGVSDGLEFRRGDLWARLILLEE